MAIGRTITREELNSVAGGIGTSLWAVIDNIQKAKAVVDDYDAAALQSLFGFTAQDAADLKAAYADMGQLVEIFRGQVNLAVAKNFRPSTRKLLGTGLY
jgi:hypothetical protein